LLHLKTHAPTRVPVVPVQARPLAQVERVGSADENACIASIASQHDLVEAAGLWSSMSRCLPGDLPDRFLFQLATLKLTV
jgi:hypothetical protein